ncbi:astacin [Necator americanus]|uniref:Metalloendopeptidase n=1 Tax=Necator americanus TaxID=51031 RepID=W2T6Z8_NECAM|nr:astacin [Necator americanus]ETN77775.1 astacin [Necator americanus]
MTTVALVMCPHCIEPTDNIHDLPLTVLDVLASKCFRSATHPGSDFRITAVADRFAETLGAGLLHKAQKEPALWVTRRKVGAHHEVKLLEKAFASYHKNTCIRFQPRNDEEDYLNIVKGFGCYSQVGRTGGKQEISLGRDRDEHIHIRWDNILPGMRSQFDKISASLQDTQGEKYDYRSIMHYDSTAFSRNGRNTIEPVQEGFTEVIGSATDLSHLDIVKINKLYQCASKRKEKPKSSLENAQSVLTSKEIMPGFASVKRSRSFLT